MYIKINSTLLKSIAFACSAFAFTACSDKDDDSPLPEAKTAGIYIVNEGRYNSPTATISYYNVNSKQLENNYFKKINNRPLGDLAQSLFFYQDKGYIVVSNSNKIEVVTSSTFQSTGVIENLQIPRYFVAQNNKGYVSEVIDYMTADKGRVSVIDLTTNKVSKTIEVDKQPEQLFITNDRLFVTCRGSNTVQVINLTTELIEKSISVPNSPNSLVKDVNNNLWILCGGLKDYVDPAASEAGKLIKVNPVTMTVEQSFSFTDKSIEPQKLTINKTGNKLYYIGVDPFTGEGPVYELSVSDQSLKTMPLINRNLYSVGVDQDNNTIYAGRLNGFTDDSWMIRYQLDGTVLDSFQVGVGPNSFNFR